MDSTNRRRVAVMVVIVLVLSTSLVLLLSLPRSPPQTDARLMSVILMIGDGMGYEHVKLASWVEVGVDGNLSMEAEPPRFWMTTYSADSDITDSAAAATAFATGHKTNNGFLSVDPDGYPLKTITEIAQELEKSTGVISTCYVQHATPAAFMSHVLDRAQTSEITEQIVETSGIDVIMGGGSRYFDYNSIDTMESQGYSVVNDSDSLSLVTEGRVLGLFAFSHMSYERLRHFESEPSLAEMTRKSLEILSQDPDGFFLMVEGGKIDLAAHDNNALDVALDTIAFDDAVAVVLEYIKNSPETIVIITADHETGGLTVLEGDLGDDIPTITCTEEQNRTLRINRVNNITVDWNSTYHTTRHVPVFCYGEAIATIPQNATIDNVDLFTMMNSWLTTEEDTVSALMGIQTPIQESIAILLAIPPLIVPDQMRISMPTKNVKKIRK